MRDNYDDRYNENRGTRPKPVQQDGHHLVSVGATQYRCTRCQLHAFLPAAKLEPCKADNPDQPAE